MPETNLDMTGFVDVAAVSELSSTGGLIVEAAGTWIAVFVADMAQALLHRAYHNIPWLWRFHAVHHSSRHMDWLAGSRIHFVEIVLTRSAVQLPLLMLGFSTPAVNAWSRPPSTPTAPSRT